MSFPMAIPLLKTRNNFLKKRIYKKKSHKVGCTYSADVQLLKTHLFGVLPGDGSRKDVTPENTHDCGLAWGTHAQGNTDGESGRLTNPVTAHSPDENTPEISKHTKSYDLKGNS